MPNVSPLALYFPRERILFTSFPIFNFSNIHFTLVYVFWIFFYSGTIRTKILYQFLAYSIRATYPGHHCLRNFNTINVEFHWLRQGKLNFGL